MALPGSLVISPPPSKWRRRIRRILLSVLVLVGVQVAWRVIEAHLAHDDLTAALAEVDALSPGWQLEALEAARPAVPDEENAGACVRAAAQRLPEEWQRTHIPEEKGGERPLPKVEELLPPAQLDEWQTAALRKVLQPLKPAIAEAHKLAKLPRGRYAVTWTPDFLSTLVPHNPQIRAVAELLGHDVALRIQEGDTAGAWEACVAVLNAGRSVGDEPLLIPQLARLNCRREAVVGMERTLAQGQLPAKALAEAQALLETEAAYRGLAAGIRGERAGFHTLLHNIESGHLPLNALAGKKRQRGLWDNVQDIWVVPRLKRSHAWLLRYFTKAVAIAEGPLEMQEADIRALEKQVHDAPPVAKLMTPGLSYVAGAETRIGAQLRCALTALAAERYRLARGRWPDSLQAVVDAGLVKGEPRDLYNSQPLDFRRSPDGVVIYSVGPGRQYDGTALDAEPFVRHEAAFEFRLWDPERRRQPPRPEKLPDPYEDVDP